MKAAAAVLAALTGLRLVVAALLPLTPDEAYYWVWSRALAPGYVDHPPMAALWIRAGTTLIGETPLGVRLLGPLAAALSTLLLVDAAERLLPGRRAGLIAGALWNATLLVGAGSIVMTPDAPLLLFWCATLSAMARLATGGGAWWWLAAGLFAGLTLASKYTGVLLWFGIGAWVLAVPSARRHLRCPYPWVGAVVGLAVFAPVVLWNADHGWVSFLKQGGRVADWRPGRAVQFLAELIGGQIGLATPGVWFLCVVGLVKLLPRPSADTPPPDLGPFRGPSPQREGESFSVIPRIVLRHMGLRATRALLLALSLPAILVFTQHAFGDRVQGNWPAILYPAAVIAAAGLGHRSWRRLVWPSVGLGLGLTAIVLLHVTTGLVPLPPRSDPAARQLSGWNQLASGVETARLRERGTFIVAEEYALIAELAWNAPLAVPVVGIESRLEPLDLIRTDLTDRSGILVRAEHRGEDIDRARWSSAVFLGFIERGAERGQVDRYRLWRVIGRGNAIALPRPKFAAGE